jgi:hypothetical protein
MDDSEFFHGDHNVPEDEDDDMEDDYYAFFNLRKDVREMKAILIYCVLT